MVERLVVVGGDAGGMAAASTARRHRRDLEIVALERGHHTSYSACGIPYLIGGDVHDVDDLVVRSPQTFRDEHRIDVRVRHEAMAIDLDRRQLEVFDHGHRRSYTLPFDTLHLATGAVPARPDLPGADDPMVHGVQTLDDGEALLAAAQRRSIHHVVIVGGGYIGLEMAEAFVRRGAETTVVTASEQPLPSFDPDIGGIVADEMRDHGITVRCGEEVLAFEKGVVRTVAGEIEADLVVLGTGVAPNSALASAAGIATGVQGAVRVDRRQRTSAEGVWAAGDCCESFHRVTGQFVHLPLGTVANKQGRVAGTNIGGGYATFPGVLGTAATRLCTLEVARTGLTEREAAEAGFDHVAVTIDATTRAAYLPGAQPIRVKLVAERRSGRVLGAQILGREGAAKRIDVVATAVTAGMTVDEMTALDLSYAPPFSPVWDPVLVAARSATRLV